MIDLAPAYTVASQPQYVPKEENIGVLENIKDGSDSTVYGFQLNNSPVSGPQFPWYGHYELTFNGAFYVDTIRIVHERGSITPDSPTGWITAHSILCNCLSEADTVISVCNTSLHSPLDNTYTIQTRIKAVRLTITVEGKSGRTGGVAAFLKNVYINGVGFLASPIKIQTLSGVSTLAKNTDLYGPVRYQNDSGIESLAVVSVSDPKASNIRIRTNGQTKAFVKI